MSWYGYLHRDTMTAYVRSYGYANDNDGYERLVR